MPRLQLHDGMDVSDGETATGAQPVRTVQGGTLVLSLVVLAWAVTLARFLWHRVLLSFDTVNNYAHVWYVANRIWTHGQLPLRMPVLGHGQAFAFPYGFLPWATAALLRPVLGDWTVTLWLALGAVGMVVAAFTAFPELRRGWWAAAVLLNPAVIEAALFGQLSFAWAASLLLFGIAAWRRGATVAAVILVGLAQATHPAVALPLAAILVACWLPFERRPRLLLGCFALTLLIAAPAVILTLTSPVFGDASTRDVAVNFISTLASRSSAIFMPLLFAVAARHLRSALAGITALGVAVLMNVALQAPMRVAYGWNSLSRNDRADSMHQFLHTTTFVRNRTYRVLRDGDAKLGMYRLLQAGGHIDSEFFPEGMAIKSFIGPHDYQRLLCERRVDYVLDFASYDVARHTNEHRMLLALSRRAGGPVRVRLTMSSADLDVFAIDRTGCHRPR